MRRPIHFLLCLALGCASAEGPSPTADLPPEAGSTEDAWFGGGFAPGEAPPGLKDGGAQPSEIVWLPPPAQASQDTADSPADAPTTDAIDETLERSAPVPPFDPGEGGVCAAPLAAGDLVIVELMIESVAGAGDHGEWLEVQSTLDCALDIRGLRGDAPGGSKVRSFNVGTDLWIAPHGTFVVADSSNVALNDHLPGTIVAWAGQPGDVLRNKGGTVTLQYDGTIIDSVTYPSMSLSIGASVSFPSNCPPTRRPDWTAWQPSAGSWFPGFYGTPNAPNDDVQCF